MNPVVILEKLLDIDRAVGREDIFTIRKRIIEAQDCVLSMQRVQMEVTRVTVARADSR